MNPSLNMRNPTRPFFVLLALMTLTGCATKFEPKPLSADHPASVEAQEAPRVGMMHLLVRDELTQRTNTQLVRQKAPVPNFQSGGMSHDLSSMGGVDHSRMPGMTMPAPTSTASPSSKEAAGVEMKAESDAAKPSSDSTQSPQTAAAYWTCVMHPEIHADKPGQCPKCGMTLVKKEGGAK